MFWHYYSCWLLHTAVCFLMCLCFCFPVSWRSLELFCGGPLRVGLRFISSETCDCSSRHFGSLRTCSHYVQLSGWMLQATQVVWIFTLCLCDGHLRVSHSQGRLSFPSVPRGKAGRGKSFYWDSNFIFAVWLSLRLSNFVALRRCLSLPSQLVWSPRHCLLTPHTLPFG